MAANTMKKKIYENSSPNILQLISLRFSQQKWIKKKEEEILRFKSFILHVYHKVKTQIIIRLQPFYVKHL